MIDSGVTERLSALGSMLRSRFDRISNARGIIEQRWMDDMRQYHGKYSHDVETRLERDRTGASKLFVNLTRPRCKSMTARLSDMLFPSEDRNFELRPTPVPDMDMEAATAAAKGMQTKIDDQLTEALYQDKARDAIHWAVLLGTGIVKGPIANRRVENTWSSIDGTMYQLDTQLVHVPTVECVSPWDFYPEGLSHEWDSCFEKRYIGKRALRGLAKNPRYNADAIRSVLREVSRANPMRDARRQEMRALAGNASDNWNDNEPYELIEYHGALDREDMLALGLDVAENDDPLIATECTVEFIDTHIIRAELHPLETNDQIYSVFNLVADEACVFGYGMPYLLRSPQIAVNSSWRMMLDNANYSIGPQIIINRETIVPANGDYALTPRKLWYLDDPVKDVRQAFHSFEVSCHQPSLMNIYQTAKQLIEEESQLPSLMQGEMGSTPIQTASGMSMLSNNAGTIIRDVVKDWDEKITKPLIRRLYDWNMQYSDDPSIKGDFKVDARGSSALMVKETQMPALVQLAQLAQQPGFAPIVKFAELFRALVETLKLSPERLAKTDEELAIDQQAMQQQAGADPAMQQQAASEQEQKQLDYQMHAEKLATDERMKVADLRDRQEQRAFEAQKEQLKYAQFAREAELKAAFGSGV